MILTIYLTTVLFALIMVLLIKATAMQRPSDPFEAMNELYEISREYPKLGKFLEYALDNPEQVLVLFAICPLFNLIFIFACGKILLEKDHDED
jgi:hypothetical protein